VALGVSWRTCPALRGDLVNMLLTDLSRLDFRQLFICHKSLFYEAYKSWTDQKKDFVVRFLQQEYAMDKAGAREALFGTEPSMENVPRPAAIPHLGGRRQSIKNHERGDRSCLALSGISSLFF